MSVHSIQTNQFQNEVLKSDRPVLVDFWAPWCGPCRMVAPVLEEIAREHPEIHVRKVNVDEEPSLAQQFQITAIPALILFKDGKAVKSAIGVQPKETIEGMMK